MSLTESPGKCSEKLVRVAGLEPAHLSALPPQSSVSANSTIRAIEALLNQFTRTSASGFCRRLVNNIRDLSPARALGIEVLKQGAQIQVNGKADSSDGLKYPRYHLCGNGPSP